MKKSKIKKGVINTYLVMIFISLCLLTLFNTNIIIVNSLDKTIISCTSIYRESDNNATIKVTTNSDGTLYYYVTDSSNSPSIENLTNWNNYGTVLANQTNIVTITSLNTGTNNVYLIVETTNGISNVETIHIPYNYYYYDDFEAYNDNTYINHSSKLLNPIKQKHNGNGDSNQKVLTLNDNKVLSLTSNSNASMHVINLPETYKTDYYALTLKAKVMATSEGRYGESILFGIGDRKAGVLFRNKKICFADKLDINNISYEFNRWYEVEIFVNLSTNKYYIIIDDITVAFDIDYNDNDNYVTMFSGHDTTTYFDDIQLGLYNDNERELIASNTIEVKDTTYNKEEQKQLVNIPGLTENRDYITKYSDNCTDAGIVYVTVTGINKYTGSFHLSYNINKANQEQPSIPIVLEVSEDNVTLEQVPGCEYSIDNENWQDSNIFTHLIQDTNYTFYQRYKETNNYLASTSTSTEILYHYHVYYSEWDFDSYCHWKECKCGETTTSIEHTFCSEPIITKEPTEETEGLQGKACDTCSYIEYTTIPKKAHTHKYDDDYLYDNNNHWKECKCGESTKSESHTFSSDPFITKEPTEETEGLQEQTCDTCSYIKITTLPKKEHTHDYEDIYHYDDNNHWKKCKGCDDTLISGHNFSEWVVTKDATTTEQSQKKRTCNCGYEQISIIDMIPSNNTVSNRTIIITIISSCIVVLLTTFSVIWFIIKKKSIRDLGSIFKKGN